MKFHDYEMLFSALRRAGAAPPNMAEADWYRESLSSANAPRDPIAYAQLAAERDWLAARRPYYSAYPLVAPSLIRLPLDIDGGLIRLPLPTLLVRFPVGHELDVIGDGSRLVRSILAASLQTSRGPGLAILIDFGERRFMFGAASVPIYSYRVFAARFGEPLEKTLCEIDRTETDSSAQESDVALLPCVRLICTLCLLGDDPSLIQPDVLDKDRPTYAREPRQEIVDRARRRGKIGWLIGVNLTIDPHYRRPHFALRWTGEGRAVPKIVPVKGAVVHRAKLSDVPTGYLGDQ